MGQKARRLWSSSILPHKTTQACNDNGLFLNVDNSSIIIIHLQRLLENSKPVQFTKKRQMYPRQCSLQADRHNSENPSPQFGDLSKTICLFGTRPV